jgi:hypothetical protein
VNKIIPGMLVLPARPMANFDIGKPVEVLDVRTRPDGSRECAVLNGGPNNQSVRWYSDADLVEVLS